MRPGPEVALALVVWGAGAATSVPAMARQVREFPSAPASAGAPHIAIITVGPGRLVWELFGHNMIRVTDPATGTDLAYNFGIFDFNQKNFYLNFLQGRMLYALDTVDATVALEFYGRSGRSIRVQELALAPDQARTLAQNLSRNAEPDQRNYRYDYYRDNCSTRVRDALNLVLAGSIEHDLSRIPTPSTYRSQTAELTAGHPALYFGLMVLLGPATDRPLSGWEESFIPMALARHLESETTLGTDGAPVPLVANASFQAARGALSVAPRRPAAWLGWFLVVGVLLGGVLAWAGARSGAGRGRGAFVALGGLWSLISGLAGLILMYLWVFTDHAVAYRNENVLQASVLGLMLFALMAAWARRGGPAPGGVRTVSLIVAALSLAGVVLQVLPWFAQVNAVALVFFVPANLGMALGAVRAVPAAPKTTEPTEAPLSRP